MSLQGPTRLGPCEILLPLGAGGMGEVYRARDTIHAIERLDDTLCMVMELVEDRILSDVVGNDGLPVDRSFDLAIPTQTSGFRLQT
jgi:hypothetical protein